MDITSLDIANSNLLDLDELPVNTDSFSNGDGDGEGFKLTPEMIAAGLGAVTAVASAVKRTDSQKDLISVCGRRPAGLLGLNKKKLNAYNDCVSDYNKEKNASSVTYVPVPSSQEDDKKGMPTWAIVTLSVVGVALVGTGIFIAVKKIKAKKA